MDDNVHHLSLSLNQTSEWHKLEWRTVLWTFHPSQYCLQTEICQLKNLIMKTCHPSILFENIHIWSGYFCNKQSSVGNNVHSNMKYLMNNLSVFWLDQEHRTHDKPDTKWAVWTNRELSSYYLPSASLEGWRLEPGIPVLILPFNTKRSWQVCAMLLSTSAVLMPSITPTGITLHVL